MDLVEAVAAQMGEFVNGCNGEHIRAIPDLCMPFLALHFYNRINSCLVEFYFTKTVFVAMN